MPKFGNGALEIISKFVFMFFESVQVYLKTFCIYSSFRKFHCQFYIASSESYLPIHIYIYIYIYIYIFIYSHIHLDNTYIIHKYTI